MKLASPKSIYLHLNWLDLSYDFEVIIMSHQDILWLQVPVHHILGVNRLQYVYDLSRINAGCLLMQAT
jgi:hypothetical protein